eukprot:11409527-Alexandrium_andersonii.AAC.1
MFRLFMFGAALVTLPRERLIAFGFLCSLSGGLQPPTSRGGYRPPGPPPKKETVSGARTGGAFWAGPGLVPPPQRGSAGSCSKPLEAAASGFKALEGL